LGDVVAGLSVAACSSDLQQSFFVCERYGHPINLGIDEIFDWVQKKAPLRRNIDAAEVGKTAVYLASDLSTGVTGETIFVDAGYNIVGL